MAMFDGPIGIIKTGLTLSAIAAVFLSIGTLDPHLNFCDGNWTMIGFHRAEVKSAIVTFPSKHCPEAARPICRQLSDGVLWFTGLDKDC